MRLLRGVRQPVLAMEITIMLEEEASLQLFSVVVVVVVVV